MFPKFLKENKSHNIVYFKAQTQVYKEKIYDLEQKITKLATDTPSIPEPSIQDNSAAIAAATEAANTQIAELMAKLSEHTRVHEELVVSNKDEEKRLHENISYLQAQNETLQRELLEKDESLEKFSLSESGIENLRRELALIKEENERERLLTNTEYEQKLEEKSAQLMQLTEELTNLKNSMATLESERNNVEDECEILRAECKTRDKQLQELSDQVAKLTAELSVQMAESATLDELLKEQQVGSTAGRTQLEEKISMIAKLQEEIRVLQSEKATLESNLQNVTTELKKLAEIQKQFEESLKATTSADEEKAEALKQLEAAMEELKQQVQSTHCEKTELDAELKRITELKVQLEVSQDSLQKQLQESTQAFETNKMELQDTKTTVESLQKQLASLSEDSQKALTAKITEIDSLNTEIKQLQDKTKTLESDSSTATQQLSSKLNELQALVKDLQQSLKSSEIQLAEQQQLNNELRSVNVEKLSELTKAVNDLERTSSQLEKLKEEKALTQSKNHELEEQLRRSEETFTQKELLVGDLNRKYEALNEKCEQYVARNESLQQDLLNARASDSDTQTTVRKLNEEITNRQKAFDELQNVSSTERFKFENQVEELQQKLTNSFKDHAELKENMEKLKDELALYNKQITTAEEKNVKQELLLSDALRQQENLQTKYDALATQNVELQNDLTNLRSSSTDSNTELLKLSQDVAIKQKSYEELLDKSSSERAALESQLQASQQRVDALCSQVEALTQELKATTEESFKRFEQLKQSEENIGKQELELRDTTRKLEALTAKSGTLETQNEAMQKDLTALRATSTDSSSEVLKLTEEIAKKQKAQQELSDKTNAERLRLESQLQETMLRFESIQTELESARNELKSTIDEKVAQTQEFESINAELKSSSQKQLENFQAKATAERKTLCESFEQQLLVAEKTKITLDEAISSLQQQIQLLQDELLKSQLDFKSKEEDLSQKLAVFIAEKEQLHTTLKQVQNTGSSNLASVQQEKSELLQNMQQLTDELKRQEVLLLAANSEAEQQKLAQANASSDMTVLEAQIKSLENTVELSNAQLTHQAKIAVEDKNKIEELKALLEALQVSNSNMSATNAELSVALQLLESEKCETAQNFELFEIEADKNVEELKAAQALMQQQLADKQQLLQTNETTLAETQKLIEKLTADLKTATTNLDGAQSQSLEQTTKLAELQEASKEYALALAESDAKIQQLTAELGSKAAGASAQTEELVAMREELTKLQSLVPTETDVRERAELEHQLAEYKLIVDEMDDASAGKTSTITELQQRLQQLGEAKQKALEAEKARDEECKNLRRKLESLELEKAREVVALQGRINDLQSHTKLKQNGGDSGGGAIVAEEGFKGTEMNDDNTAQINFLNSIIADMQKKNDTLKAKIEALEALPTDFTKPHAFDVITKRKPAPRVFCDICDVFDQHETEDCPLQASDEREYSPPVSAIEHNNNNNDVDKKKERKLPEPRKYCESCEVFGHESGECDDECF